MIFAEFGLLLFTIAKYLKYYIILLQQPKTAPKERRGPISVALERGLNASHYASIQPTVIESQI